MNQQLHIAPSMFWVSLMVLVAMSHYRTATFPAHNPDPKEDAEEEREEPEILEQPTALAEHAPDALQQQAPQFREGTINPPFP